MKGIILAGGSGTRLYPATIATCKQLLPVYDKPMIYYPLSVLMLAGIREILIISTAEDLPRFQRLFGDGSRLGLKFSYVVQEKPEGLAQAFILGEEFLQGSSVCLILGDNIFYGHDLPFLLRRGVQINSGGLIFGMLVKNPSAYGVVSFDEQMNVLAIEEKPSVPKSSYAVPGLYFYGPEVVDIAKRISPSKRGELEITDIHQAYLAKDQLQVCLMGRGYAWLDAGTFDDLYKASNFVQTIEERQGIKIACIEEIAYRMGYIDQEELLQLSDRYMKNDYGRYLRRIAISSNYLEKAFC
jgi:glucose-1-phosphate thymidylyltransferase